ncbi:MAG TPA: nucleotidyltransferase family protein [Bryobacteraceae bacterium]
MNSRTPEFLATLRRFGWARRFRLRGVPGPAILPVRARNVPLAASVPLFGKAVLETLQLSGQRTAGVRSLSFDDWNKLLAFCDAAQLTLTFSYLCGSELPDWVQARIDQNYRDAAARGRRLDSALNEIAHRFKQADIEFVLLKGRAHAREFGPDPSLRVTSDVDLWCTAEQIGRARDELGRLGYRRIGKENGNHLAPMIREKKWCWRGNFYAPDLPLPVELHHRLWDEKMERIQGPPEAAFWRRRSYSDFEGALVSVLALPDALAFSALHLLKHILHGDLRLQRAWEVAYFLHRHSTNDAFWRAWMNLHPDGLRKLEVLIFLLVEKWFGCKLPTVVLREAETLAGDIRLWIQLYGFSPVEALFSPNKTELWLNLSLVSSLRGKIQVFLRRMLPVHGLKTVSLGASGEPHSILSRVSHHVRTLGPTLVEGAAWWRIRNARGGI